MVDSTTSSINIAQTEFRIGHTLSETFQVLFSRLPMFFLISAVVAAPMVWVSSSLEAGGTTEQQMAIAATLLLSLSLSPLVTAVILHAAFQVISGRPVNFGESLSTGFARMFPLILVVLLYTVGVSLGMILLIVPGLIFMVAWYVAIPICVVERRGPIESLKRSQELTGGSRWKLLGLLLIGGVIGAVGNGVISGVAMTVAGPTVLLVLTFLTFIWQALVQAFTSVLNVVAYYHLRQSKEGVDIEELVSVFD